MSTRQNSLPYNPKAGSLTKSSWSFLAPALHQRLPSVLTALRTSWMLGVAFSNTHELQCFHTSQATKIIRELRPFRSALGTDDIAFHHHLEKRDDVDSGELRPKYWKIRAHI
jgi:hypothetical protein